ncbi:hypothetical protein V2J09_013140 [Rumex salicifolius]
MGLSNFPAASEGVLPAIVVVVNTAVSMEVLKGLLKSVVETTTGGGWRWAAAEEDMAVDDDAPSGKRRVSVTQFKGGGKAAAECSVCLTAFEEGVEVSELRCKHAFHRSCLDKWFDHHHSTCPLCRSIQ